ncbi:hypothetical protein WJX81_004294 [Elliptochloris bilobata]|uniref:BRCT domain-containing protein n=1 Tax=Elliptochloris bilobata TaxID=381761 RepID=A0AAW1QGS3_9CHLO
MELSGDSVAKLGRELVCPICLSLLSAPTRLKACLRKWLAEHKECPECREPASRRDIFRDERFDELQYDAAATVATARPLPCRSALGDARGEHAKKTAAGARVAAGWEPAATHVVCGVTPARAAKRTFKFMMGVLNARWVVAPSWLAACEAAGAPVPEEPHEVRSNTAGGDSGPVLGRTQAGRLLHGYEVFLAGAFSKRGQAEDLLRAAGVQLLTRMPLPSSQSAYAQEEGLKANLARRVALVLWDPDAGPAPPAAPAGVPRVRLKWLYDCAGSFQRFFLEGYV